MEGVEKYLKLIEKELKSLEKSKKESIINELKDHLNERLSEEEKKSLDKIIEVIGKPEEVAKGFLNICEAETKTQKKWIIGISIIVGIILLIFGIFYFLHLHDAISKDEIEYTKFLLFIPFILLAISIELIFLSISQKSGKFFKKFKSIFFAYLTIGVILISVALFPLFEKNDLTTTISIPDASHPEIKIDNENNVYIVWTNRIINEKSWDYTIHYGKLNKKQEIEINDFLIGSNSYFKFEIDNIGNLHIIYREEILEENFIIHDFLRYIKINPQGKIVTELTISEFFDFSKDSFSLAIDSKNIPHIIYLEGYMHLGSEKIRYPVLTYVKIDEKGKFKYENLSYDCPHSPKITVDTDDNIYVVWKDAKNWHENNSAGTLEFDVFLTKITDNKIVVNKTKLSDKPNELNFPKIFNIDEDVIIFWNDDKNIYWEIYDNKSSGKISFYNLKDSGSKGSHGPNQYRYFNDIDERIFTDTNGNFYIKRYLDGKICYLNIPKSEFETENHISAKERISDNSIKIYHYSQFIDFDINNKIHVVYSKKSEHEKYNSYDIFYTDGNSTIQINPNIEYKDDINEVKITGISIILLSLIPIIDSFKGVKKLKK